jgi:hypothetical protein
MLRRRSRRRKSRRRRQNPRRPSGLVRCLVEHLRRPNLVRRLILGRRPPNVPLFDPLAVALLLAASASSRLPERATPSTRRSRVMSAQARSGRPDPLNQCPFCPESGLPSDLAKCPLMTQSGMCR